MPKLITFMIATKDGPQPTEGRVAILRIDGKPHRFIMSENGDLSDWRSGYRVGSFRMRQAINYASDPYARRMTERQAAQAFLSNIVMRYGADKVRETLAAPPTLNT